MTEPAPEIEQTAAQVEIGIEFKPFEFDHELPEIESAEPGAFFVKKLALRGFDHALLTFDQDPDSPLLENINAVLITHEGIKRVSNKDLSTQEIKALDLFEFTINLDHHQSEKDLNWRISFPKFNFEASRFHGPKAAIPSSFFKDAETGKETTVFIQRNLNLLKELNLQFFRKQHLTQVK